MCGRKFAARLGRYPKPYRPHHGFGQTAGYQHGNPRTRGNGGQSGTVAALASENAACVAAGGEFGGGRVVDLAGGLAAAFGGGLAKRRPAQAAVFRRGAAGARAVGGGGIGSARGVSCAARPENSANTNGLAATLRNQSRAGGGQAGGTRAAAEAAGTRRAEACGRGGVCRVFGWHFALSPNVLAVCVWDGVDRRRGRLAAVLAGGFAVYRRAAGAPLAYLAQSTLQRAGRRIDCVPPAQFQMAT